MQFSKLLIATVAFALSASALPTPDEATTAIDKSTEATGNICPSKSDIKQICCNKTDITTSSAKGLLAFAGSVPTNADVTTLGSQVKGFQCAEATACTNEQYVYCCNQKAGDGNLIVFQNCGDPGVDFSN